MSVRSHAYRLIDRQIDTTLLGVSTHAGLKRQQHSDVSGVV